ASLTCSALWRKSSSVKKNVAGPIRHLHYTALAVHSQCAFKGDDNARKQRRLVARSLRHERTEDREQDDAGRPVGRGNPGGDGRGTAVVPAECQRRRIKPRLAAGVNVLP